MTLSPTPMADLDTAMAAGFDRLYAADPRGAATAFRRAWAIDPACGDAWAGWAETSGAASAPTGFGRAARLDPDRWDWSLHHAEALLAAGRPEALAVFAALAARRPDAAAARRGLGRALRAAGRLEEAAAEVREALSLAPDDAETAAEAAELLAAAGDALGALELLQPLRRHRPDEPSLLMAEARAWMALGEAGKARGALDRLLAAEPDHVHGRALMAALDAGGAEEMSAAYVRALFDRYAERFDDDLTGKLAYAAPALLRAAVLRRGPASGLSVLDLGCGTGLAGVALRDVAGHLAGVDLSPRMVDKARQRGLYDALSVGDVVDALRASTDRWDLVVAADVFVYLGDLGPVFQAAAGALRAGGRLAATVERLDAADGFILGPTRRYAHAAGHLQSCAAAAGLTLAVLEPCAPRREKGVPVDGLLLVATKV